MIAWLMGNENIYPTWTEENFLEWGEVDSLIEMIENTFPLENAIVTDPKMSIRESQVRWVFPNEDSVDIFEKLTKEVATANQWNFYEHLLGFEPLQYTVYNSNVDKAYYGKHRDNDATMINSDTRQRCLSFSVQLSDPEEYEGGDLIIYDVDTPIHAPRTRGSITIFRSTLTHEVTPVTMGVRKSLVGWVQRP